MQVSCQAGKHEGCASLHLPPNSLELFTLFSLPFLHFYNFLGTQVERSGGRSVVLSGPPQVGCLLRSSVGTWLLSPFSPIFTVPPRTPRRPSQVSFPPHGFTVMHKPLKLLALPHRIHLHWGLPCRAHQAPTCVRDPDDRDRLERRSGSCGAHCPSLLQWDPIP